MRFGNYGTHFFVGGCGMRVGKVRKCRECLEEFEVCREWQIFCSGRCRLRWNNHRRDVCFYCGAYGYHRDHVDPNVFAALSGVRHFRGVEYVWACLECNSDLGANIFSSVADRIEFLISRYTAKYGITKPVIEWADEELDEIGPGLKRRIRHLLAKRRVAEERVEYLHAMKQSFLPEGESG